MADKPKKELASVWALYRESYELVKRNLNLFIFFFSIQALVAIWNFLDWLNRDSATRDNTGPAYSQTFSLISGLDVSSPVAASVTLSIVLGVLSIIFTLLQTIFVLRVARGGRVEFGDVWNEFKGKGLRLLGLMIVLVVLLILGFIALVIPGLIFLWRFFLAPYILLDKDTSISEAVVQSWEQTKGYAGPVYAVIGVFILIGIAGLLPLFGPLVSFLMAVAFAVVPPLRYLEIKQHRPRHPVSIVQNSE